jgi:uncharacterized protein (DUF4213/DUF364 family)
MDILKQIYLRYGVDINSIAVTVFGKTYSCVQLIDGKIGVAANLFGIESFSKDVLKTPDFTDLTHRNVLIAYYNAMFNIFNNRLTSSDIFDFIKFENYSNIVMVGYSVPMYDKLMSRNIKLSVFDYSVNNRIVKDQNELDETLIQSDLVILTATSLINNTFDNIVKQTGKNCEIYIFGASTMLNKEFFEYENVKGLFGTVFEQANSEILKIVGEGFGYRNLKQNGKKVALIR